MVIKNGFGVATYASNSLMTMYFKSGMIRDARVVFYSAAKYIIYFCFFKDDSSIKPSFYSG